MHRNLWPVLFTILTAPALAQEAKDTPRPPANQPAAPQQEPKPTMPRVSLAFPGGSLADFVALLRQQDQRLNVIAVAECTDVVLPPMTMNDVSVQAALRAAAGVADNEYQVKVDVEGQGGGAPVFSVLAMRRGRGNSQSLPTQGQPANTPRMAVFTLAKLTGGDGQGQPADLGFKPETVLSAIAAGTSGTPMQPPTLRYHAESGLLFAYGAPDQLQYVQQVLTNLEESIDIRAQQRDQRRRDREAEMPGGKSGKAPAKSESK